MEYILAKKTPGTCVFCTYAASEPERFVSDLVLVSDERAFVVLNRYPFAAGHLLVIPKVHVADLSDLDFATHDALFRLTREVVTRLRRAVGAQGINVGMNLGEAAGAGIAEHLHVHVVPRWAGDTNFMPVVADVRVMPQHLEATYRHLQPHFADLPGAHAALP